jgi:hypothetical protein
LREFIEYESHPMAKLSKELPAPLAEKQGNTMTDFYDLQMKTIHGETLEFSQFRDQLCLIVNVATE